MKKYEYDGITSLDVLRTLVHKFQNDAYELNNEVRIAKQENILLKKRIQGLKRLYHLRLKEEIDTVLTSI
jgi:hypothetical protein